jgi:hypothetical protein
MFFVNSLTAGTGVSTPLYGFGFVNGSGIAISANTFSFVSTVPSRWDTLAHEIGHNLGIDHCTNGAGFQFNAASTTCPSGLIGVQCGSPISTTGGVPVSSGTFGGCNLMDNGTIRILPKFSGCTMQTWATAAASSGGVLYDLDTANLGTVCCPLDAMGMPVCATPATTPFNPIADQLVLSTQDHVLSSTFVSQQTAALASGFINTQPNVNATFGGGNSATTIGGASAADTTASCSCPTTPPPPGVQTFCVTNTSGLDIAALLLSVPNTYNFTSPQFQLVCGPGTPTPSPAPTAQVLHGNTGAGNNNCQKALPIASDASFSCLEIDFPVTEQPVGTFTSTFPPGTTLVFNTDIHTTSPGGLATLQQLGCAHSIPQGCLDITEVFVNTYATTSFFDTSGNASTLSPDGNVPPTLVNPAFFPTLANLSPPPTFNGSPNPVTGSLTPAPCTPKKGSGKCPPLAGGDPVGGD